MQLFFGEVVKESAVLSGDEARHASKVLRKQVGDNIQLIDGSGALFFCEIVGIQKHEVFAKVLKRQADFGKIDYELHLAIAPTKNIDRLEWLLEKSTEMGLTAIYPIICSNSERRKVRIDRLERIALSAAKQSLKGKVPVVHPLQTFTDFIATPLCEQRFLAHCYKKEKAVFKDVLNIKQPVLIMIGPEGDFSLDEVERAQVAGITSVSLGNARLRTETAGVVAVATVYNAGVL